MLSKGSADGGAPGPVSAAAEALGEILAPPDLTLDGADESEECPDGVDATAGSAALSEASDHDGGSDAEDVFALSACASCDFGEELPAQFLVSLLASSGRIARSSQR